MGIFVPNDLGVGAIGIYGDARPTDEHFGEPFGDNLWDPTTTRM